MKVVIDNFQAISHAELEFPVGITTITGPNSSGKSSVLRALDFFTTNSGKKRHIKHGEKSLSVAIEHDGTVFSWRKTKSSGAFSRNDQTVEKIGSKTPHEFFDDFPLELDERGNTLQMSGEWEILFPFDRSDSELFTLFENVFNISDSSVILSTIKSDINKTKGSIDASVKTYNRYCDIVEKLEMIPFDDVIRDSNAMYRSLKDAIDSIPDHEVVDKCENFSRFVELDLPEAQDFDLSSLIVYNELNDLNRIEGLISVYNVLDPVVKSREDMGDLSIIEDYVKLSTDLDQAERLFNCEGKLDVPLSPIDMPDFQARELLDDLNTCNDLVEKFNEVKSEQDSLVKLANELTDKIKEVKVCPLCNSKLS